MPVARAAGTAAASAAAVGVRGRTAPGAQACEARDVGVTAPSRLAAAFPVLPADSAMVGDHQVAASIATIQATPAQPASRRSNRSASASAWPVASIPCSLARASAWRSR